MKELKKERVINR